MINIAEELGKQVPSSLPAEQAILGSILINPAAFDNLSETMLSVDDFYTELNRDVFSAMKELYVVSQNIAYVTLIDKVVEVRKNSGNRKKSDYVNVSKTEIENYIKLLADSVPNANNLSDYVKIVKEKSKLRKLLDICGEISDDVLSDPKSSKEVIELAEQKIFNLSQDINSDGLVSVSDIVSALYNRMQKLAEDKNAFTGTETGFSGLDRVIEGMEPTDLVFVGARPAMGKTSFAINIATNVAKNKNKDVCIFSLEMSKEQLVERLLSSESQVELKKLHKGNLSVEDWKKIADASGFLANMKIYIDDTPIMTCTSMKAKLRRMKNLGLVLVDYLGLMRSEKNFDSRVQEVSEITRDLKLMSKELHVPVLVCAQLNRETAKSQRAPQLSDLRDSGSIEQDADIVMFIHRDEYYKGDKSDKKGIAEIIVAKNRHGETKSVEMKFIPQFTKFVTIDDNYDEVQG